MWRKTGWLALVFLLFALSGCGLFQKDKPDALNWEIEDFSYTNQEGEAFGLSDLEGKVWIADFIFTHCETACPLMTYNMVQLQEQLKEEEVEVEFVSFSVDPEVDTPQVLKEYAQKYDVDFSNWHFLTGYSSETIAEFAKNNFYSLVQKPEDSNQVIHSNQFFLVDQSGTVVQKYPGNSDVPFDQIVKDVKALQ